jgi:hypothetical protein
MHLTPRLSRSAQSLFRSFRQGTLLERRFRPQVETLENRWLLTGSATALASNPNPSMVGQAVALTATVTPTDITPNTPSGTVTFFDGANTLGMGTLSGNPTNDTATFMTSMLSLGSHTLTAKYNGDTNFTTSTSSAISQSVIQATAVTTCWW